MSLAAGDIAVVVMPAGVRLDPNEIRLNGRTVTLARICTCEICARWPRSTYWICAGVSEGTHSIAARVLRRIPPAPMPEIPELADVCA